MSEDLLLLDLDAAVGLYTHLHNAADDLLKDAFFLEGLMADATNMLGYALPEVMAGVRSAAHSLRACGDDLDDRIRVVAHGGEDMNAAFGALEEIRDNFTLIETRGGTRNQTTARRRANARRPHERHTRDDKLARADLRWARDNLGGRAAEAAAWLLEHDDYFRSVETAKHNSDYIQQAPAGGLNHDAKDRDGVLSLEDIDSFLTKATTLTTLAPYLGIIDTAAKGGKPDGMLSRADYQAFLVDYDLPADASIAVRQVLDDGAYDTHGYQIGWGTVLDAASFVPVVGDIVDGARAIYYAVKGDWATAAIYAIGIMPIPYVTASTYKVARKLVEETMEVAGKHGTKKAARHASRTLAVGTAKNLAKKSRKLATNTIGATRRNQSENPDPDPNTLTWIDELADADPRILTGAGKNLHQTVTSQPILSPRSGISQP